jgi:sepiapterin reductase
MSIEALSGKVFLVVTGASRGIGRQIAITFGSLLQEGSHILLLARDLNALQEIAKSIPSKIIINVRSMDLSKATKNDLKGKSEFFLSKTKLNKETKEIVSSKHFICF